MNYQVEFIDVGRNKRSWRYTSAHFPANNELVNQVKQSGALVSHDVWVSLDGEMESGLVLCGMRSVGGFSITELN